MRDKVESLKSIIKRKNTLNDTLTFSDLSSTQAMTARREIKLQQFRRETLVVISAKFESEYFMISQTVTARFKKQAK